MSLQEAMMNLSKRLSHKKRMMSLLEVLIALTLISSLLLVLFSVYRYIDHVHNKVKAEEKESFQALYIQSRLSQIFCHALQEPEDKDESNHFYFFSSETKYPFPYLVLTYNNRAAVPPLFSNEVIAKIYVEEDKKEDTRKLCLTIWPSPSRCKESPPPIKKEILMESISSLEFSFYLPPRHDLAERPVDPIYDKVCGWNSFWPVISQEEYKHSHLPAMIKMTIKVEEKKGNKPREYVLAFILPYTQNHIVFNE